MLNLIGKLTAAFKDLLTSRPAELFETLFLLLVALGALLIAVFDVVGHPIHILKDVGSVTLVLVALLALHFGIERFTVMHRMEKKFEFMELVGVKNIPAKIRPLINQLIHSQIELQDRIKWTGNENSAFGVIANSVVEEQAHQLQELSCGKWDVPRNRKLIAFQKLMDRYGERLDAVSEDDLTYWVNRTPDAEEYFEITCRAIINGTCVTRIFIFTLNDLTNRTADIADVLERQHLCGIGWGVAIEEDLDRKVKQGKHLDFALYDGGKAVSLFRRLENKRYETIFATRGNEKEVNSYREIYESLVPECWLVNNKFAESYERVSPLSATAEAVRNKVRSRKDYRTHALRREIVAQESAFVLKVSDAEEISDTVHKLRDLLIKFRAALGVGANRAQSRARI